MLDNFKCRDLPAADDNGVSDPYLKIQNFGGKDDFKTATIEDSINPIYYESIRMFMQYNEIHLAPPLVVDIYDYDTFSSDDFIGRALALHTKGTGINTRHLQPTFSVNLYFFVHVMIMT